MYCSIFLMLFAYLPVGGDILLVNREQAREEEEKLKHFTDKTAGVLSEMKPFNALCYHLKWPQSLNCCNELLE